MKVLKKVLLGVAVVAMSAAALSFAACGDDAETITYTGEYKYDTQYGTYGVVVAVEVADGVIKSVSTIDSDYIEVSETNTTYNWDKTVYTNSKDSLLAAYEGKTVEEILALEVAVETSGEPTIQSSSSFINYGDDLIISGATQCSGRLLLAVQDALTLKTYTGEYRYDNTYAAGSYYGVKVSVAVRGGIIESVTTIDSDYIEVSETNTTYNWDNTVYTESKADLLAAYEGKTVTEIMALEVAVETSGEPTIQSSSSFINYGDDLIITGATQCSGRLLLAVQNALENA